MVSCQFPKFLRLQVAQLFKEQTTKLLKGIFTLEFFSTALRIRGVAGMIVL